MLSGIGEKLDELFKDMDKIYQVESGEVPDGQETLVSRAVGELVLGTKMFANDVAHFARRVFWGE